ncbi:MAG: Cof-type HAD-IIB family hydrolase [Desulfobacteraceae bacterium]|nr:Cof-type HAD-IIB family hydrolase [Desulfobacteraceae bacterium]
MQKKLFITDFDRTLLRDDKTIAHRDINALEELKEQGIVSCIATGRSIYSFSKILKTFPFESLFDFPIDYLIFSTGAGIMNFNTGEIMKSFSLNESDVLSISGYFEASQLDYMVHKPVPETHCFVYKSHGKENADFFNRINLYKEYSSKLSIIKELKGFGKSTEILSILPYKSAYASLLMIEKIKQDLFQFSVIVATSPLDHKSLWVEVFHKDVSKSKAAAFLAQKLDVKRENVMSVGNDYNDMDLLEWSGKGFVVENALKDLKKMFEQVPSNNHYGVCAAVKKCIKA